MSLRKEFLNRRTRLQRLSDGRFFYGWIKSIKDGVVTIFTESEDLHRRGDRYALESFGIQHVAQFFGSAARSEPNYMDIAIEHPVQYLDPTPEEARTHISDLPLVLTWEGESVEGFLVDASTHGAGVVSQAYIDKGETVSLAIRVGGTTIQLKGEVRYCRKHRPLKDHFRLGLRLFPTDRLDSAKWSALVNAEYDEQAAKPAAR